MHAMALNVGPFAYRVRFVDGEIVDETGEACAALCDYLKQELLVSTELPPDQQFQAIMHELHHAWERHFPVGDDEERRCDLFGNIVLQLHKDLYGGELPLIGAASKTRQYELTTPPDHRPQGEPAPVEQVPDALDSRRIAPLETVEHADCVQDPCAERVQCRDCEKVFAGGAVVNDPPQWRAEMRTYVIQRHVHCDHCHHIQTWEETATASGTPTGVVLTSPCYERGAAVQRFLERHRQAAGVNAA